MRNAQPRPQDVIRRYLDSHQGLVTVLAQDLATSWQLDELRARDRRRIGRQLQGAGVHTEPALAEAQDGDLVTLFLPGSELAPSMPARLNGGDTIDDARATPAPTAGLGQRLRDAAFEAPRAPALIAVVAALVAGAGAYAIGAAGGEDIDSARAAGERAGRLAGERSGQRTGYRAGLRSGRTQGYRQTYRSSFVASCRQAVDEAETVISPEEACD